MLSFKSASRCGLGIAVVAALGAISCGDDDDNGIVTPSGGAGSTGEGGEGATSPSGGKSGSAGSGVAGTSIVITGGENAGGAPSMVDAMVMRTDLVSDVGVGGAGGAGGASGADPQLLNAWGVSFDPDPAEDTAFWVSAQGTGVSTVYMADGTPAPLVVTIPAAKAADTGSPTGQVYNETTGFKGDKFIFATEDGVIAGWKTGTVAVTQVDASADGASFKGLALVSEGEPLLLAANFHASSVDVYDATYVLDTKVTFKDPQPVKGYAPFNVAVLGNRVYVAYAKQDAAKADEVAGAGLGYVNRFESDGTFGTRLIAPGGMLNAPWGLALAPAGFTPAPSALIVGNFGDGMLHAYDPNDGHLMGEFKDAKGTPLVIDGLWALAFGPKKNAEDLSKRLFFTAGPDDEMHGVFGVLTAP